MKVVSLQKLLGDFAALLEAVDGYKALENIKILKELFVGQGTFTVAQVVAKIKKGMDSSRGTASSPTIRHFLDSIAKFQMLLASANAKEAAQDVQRLIDLINDSDSVSVRAFVEAAKIGISTPGNVSKPSVKAPSPIDAIRTELVQHYVNLLKSANEDDNAFDHAVAELAAKTKVRTVEMHEIAKIYLGYEIGKSKGRKGALQDIIDRQALDARQKAKASVQEGSKSWWRQSRNPCEGILIHRLFTPPIPRA
jgi:hypothetical protein